MRRTTDVLFVSTYPPQECGIATFTRDLACHLSRSAPWVNPRVAVIDSGGESGTQYGEGVACRIDNSQPRCYAMLAEMVNDSIYDVVCVQHEFGLFPGEWGHDLLGFYEVCRKPIVTTLHTVLPSCEALPRHILRSIVCRSRTTVVIAKAAVDILRGQYGLAGADIRVVPHGVPAYQRIGRPAAKRRLGLEGRKVVATFGLLSPGKGIEHMITGMTEVVAACPDAVYCVVGKTHPVVKRREGEDYRESLHELIRKLGLGQHVRFVNRFLSDEELAVYLEATDVYAIPYIGADQISSGTLARAAFFGKAIVSTPFLYARELLADGRGRLVPFEDGGAIGRAVAEIISDEELKTEIEMRMLRYGRKMSWAEVARQYAVIFDELAAAAREEVVAPAPTTIPGGYRVLPQTTAPIGHNQ